MALEKFEYSILVKLNLLGPCCECHLMFAASWGPQPPQPHRDCPFSVHPLLPTSKGPQDNEEKRTKIFYRSWKALVREGRLLWISSRFKIAQNHSLSPMSRLSLMRITTLWLNIVIWMGIAIVNNTSPESHGIEDGNCFEHFWIGLNQSLIWDYKWAVSEVVWWKVMI